ncbi:amidohydrolase [Chelativorans sp. J32]|uniref:amidohydrolase family protein n=1 Tax=Chelativorans sp. J32 TaxID=935840 RepID=UPI00048519B6|nr:amidohydrolase family protein [Chelativorans sp. J32]
MIIDGHCHIWESWPYEPPVPDPATRARVEQLLFEMDRNGVDRAVIICAAIGDNPHNTDYAFEAAERHRGRLVVFPDIDCRWAPEFRKPGAPARLERALSRWSFVGFTHYLAEEEDGAWLTSEEGMAFFGLAAERSLVVSLSVMPHQMPPVRALARTFPALTIICHHHAFLGPRSEGTPHALAEVLTAAEEPNILVKCSGFGNVAAPSDEYPYTRLQWIPHALKAAFGADRLIWGSDYPVCTRHMTYRQALSVLRRHGPFCEDELSKALGDNMSAVLRAAGGG